MFVIDGQPASRSDGREGVHQPWIAIMVCQQKRCPSPEPDQVVFGQPCFLTKFRDGLLFRGGSGLEVSGDAMPPSAVMSNGLASLKEGNPIASLDDHGHDRTGPAFRR
jgi:hypothetical protein